MKKQILVLAAIGIISLSASTYAQSHNENSTNEPYAGTKEDNQIKTSPNTQETSHMNLRKRPNDVEDEPTLNTGLYDED